MSTITNPQHDLQFGSLDLTDIDATQGAGAFRYEVLATDANWGNPVPIEEKIVTWLQDGAIVALQGYDNRDLFLKVRVIGRDGLALALGEQALMLETGKPNTLTWTPPDGVAKPCVFSVVTSHLEHTFDDLAELHLERTYGLRVTAEPFVRSLTPVQVSQAAPPGGGPTVTSIDACTSTTGWTGLPNAATTSGGAVKTQRTPPPNQPPGTISLERTGLSVNMTAIPYLRIDWGYTAYAGSTVTKSVKANGIELVEVASSGSVHWYDYAGSGAGTTLNTVKIAISSSYVTLTQPFALQINDVSGSNALTDPGTTNRQLARTLAVAGSARTQGSLAVEDSASALGSCLVYTCPVVDGLAQPNLRQFLLAGPTITPDSSTVSGSNSPLDTAHTFQIPVAGINPGAHLILARVKHASAGARTINFTATALQGSTQIVADQQAGQVAFTSGAGTYQIVTVGAVNLPPTKLGPAGLVNIALTGSAGLVIDEAWIFNVDSGRLTWVECGTAAPAAGGASNRLFLDAPTVQSPVPAVYRGFAADRSDTQHCGAEMLSFGNHEFVPKTMNVFTVTTNSTNSTVTLTHYPRWHTHAAA